MLDSTVALITGAVSVLTLALSRCRCIVRRSSEVEGVQWGLGFTENQLFTEQHAARVTQPRTEAVGAAPGTSAEGASSPAPRSEGA